MNTFSRIEDLGDRFNNADTHAARIAADNIAIGRPAVWSGASYSHAAAGILADAINLSATAADAFARCDELSRTRDYRKHPEWLDLMIPLNGAGVHLLADAYVIAGSFRSARELFDRADKIGWTIQTAQAA